AVGEAMSMEERYISVDVETSGPIPGVYSLLTIGACVIGDLGATFYKMLKPITESVNVDAMKVTGLSLTDLLEKGESPQQAMKSFGEWVRNVAVGVAPVFVGLNAPFDWSFVNYYFHRYVGRNPFGFAALDVKSLYMGVTGCRWSETKSSKMSAVLQVK